MVMSGLAGPKFKFPQLRCYHQGFCKDFTEVGAPFMDLLSPKVTNRKRSEGPVNEVNLSRVGCRQANHAVGGDTEKRCPPELEETKDRSPSDCLRRVSLTEGPPQLLPQPLSPGEKERQSASSSPHLYRSGHSGNSKLLRE